MRLAERPWPLLAAAIAVQWASTLLIGLRADGVELGARELVNVALLGPLALLAAFALASRVGGVALGAWTLLVWVALPWAAPLYTLAPYDSTLTNDVLPLAVGLTPDAGYFEGVALLAAVALVFDRRRATMLVGGLTLAVLAVVWISRLPAPDLSRDTFDASMAGLREYFWSQRVLQWIPLAGVIAVARRSIPLALVLGLWLVGYVAVRASQAGVGFDGGELFRELLPAYPAYVLLLSALPLLVPTLAARLGPLARPLEAP